MAAESAIIIPVPEAEPVVASLRQRHDPVAARGVPAHITLLYPFAPPDQLASHVEDLQRLCAESAAFAFSLTEVRRFPATAYLQPDPAAPFVALIERIMRRWPAFPPYGGRFATPVPHLTVADDVGPDVLDGVVRELAGQLPIACRATEVSLICSDDEGAWACKRVFALKP